MATVMVVVLLAALLAFAAAGVTTASLTTTSAVELREHARNLAEGAISKTLAEIAARETFGTAGETVRYDPGAGLPAGAHGLVTFDTSQADYSTHNLYGGAVSGSGGAQVPARTVRVIGVGRCGSVTQRVEAFYFRPPSPKGIVATGTVSAEGLFLAAVNNAAAFPGNYAGVAAEDRLPSDLISNSGGARAVWLRPSGGANSEIEGNVSARGEVDIELGCRVKGEVRQGVEEAEVPSFDVPAMIAQVERAVGLWPYPSTAYVTGIQVYGSSQNLAGDLELDNAVVCVRGDLNVGGALSGNGLVLATGDIDIAAGADFDAEELVAVACGGDLSLRGAGKNSFFFNGLLYCEGNLSASDITVVGTAIANGSGSDGNMNLQRVNVIQTSVSASFSYGFPLGGFSVHGFDESGSEPDDTWIVKLDRRLNSEGEEVFDMLLWWEWDASDLEDDNDGDGRRFDLLPDNPSWATFGGQPWVGLTEAEVRAKLSEIFLGLRGADYFLISPSFSGDFNRYVEGLRGDAPYDLALSLEVNRVISDNHRSRVTLWRTLP